MADEEKPEPDESKPAAKPKSGKRATGKTGADDSKPASADSAKAGSADAAAADAKSAETDSDSDEAPRGGESRERVSAAAKAAQEKASAAADAARREAERSYSEARTSIADSDDRTIAIVVYALYLAMFVTGGVAAIVGVILAYLKKDGEDALTRSHFDFQIRTFWLGLAGVLVSLVLMMTIIFIVIGVPLLIAVTVWWLLRIVIGLVRLLDRKPIPDPKTWLV